MQAMKGATGVLGNMNRSMNLPALQRIAMEFEKENDIMDQRQEMMDDAIDDVTGLEDEAEGEEVVEEVLAEIGVDLKNAVSDRHMDAFDHAASDSDDRWVKLLKGSKALRRQKAESHRRSGEVTRVTTISRLYWTACEGDLRLFYILHAGIFCMEFWSYYRNKTSEFTTACGGFWGVIDQTCYCNTGILLYEMLSCCLVIKGNNATGIWGS